MAEKPSDVINSVREAIEGVETLEQWRNYVLQLPEGPRTIAVSFAAIPAAAEGLAKELADHVPGADLEALREIGEKGRELGDEEELEALLNSMSSLEDRKEAFSLKEDPIRVLQSDPKISLSVGQLEIRFIGGPSYEELSLDFVKTPSEAIGLAGSILSSVENSIDELNEADLAVSKYVVDADTVREQLDRMSKLVSRLSSKLAD